MTAPNFCFGSFTVDRGRRELRWDEQSVELQSRAFDLLVYLIESRDRTVGKDELQEQVWGTVVSDAAIARAVTKVRQALDRDHGIGEIIKTVHGHGYRFVAALDEPEAAPSGAPESKLGDRRPAIAVLPFANLSSEPDTEYFSDGIGEEILTLLAKVKQLRVASRRSSFAFRNRLVNTQTIATELAADFLVEGSVRRQGDRVRISATLVQADNDELLWTRMYDRELVDVFAVQSQIASAIVGELEIETRVPIRRDIATENPDAYDFYLRGRHYFHQWDEQAMTYSREMFERAIELDPDYAMAWAGLADTLSCADFWRDSTGELLARADLASKKALRLAPELSEAHCSRGMVLSLLGRYAESYSAFDRALSLDDTSFDAYYLYARACFAGGEPARAAELFARAAAVRYDDFQAKCLEGTAWQSAGDSARAAAAAKEGVARCRRHLSLHPEDTRAWTLGAGCLFDTGCEAESLEWADRALELAPNDITVLHNVGCSYSRAGKVDRALDIFEKRFAMGGFNQDWIDNDPDFDNIRDHPRFKAMLVQTAETAAPTPSDEQLNP